MSVLETASDARLERGIRCKVEGLYDEAIPQFQALITEDPRNSRARMELGLVYGFIGLFDESLSELEQAVSNGTPDQRRALAVVRNLLKQTEQQPVAWLIDWPEEPELGHYFSDEPNEYARSRPLYAALSAVTAERDRLLAENSSSREALVAMANNCDQLRVEVEALREEAELHNSILSEACAKALAERDRLRELAYIGEHMHEDYSWKARHAELRAEVEGMRKREAQLEKLLSAAANYAAKLEPMSAKLLNAIDAAMTAKETSDEPS